MKDIIKWCVDYHLDFLALKIDCPCGNKFFVYIWQELERTSCPKCKRKFRLVEVKEGH